MGFGSRVIFGFLSTSAARISPRLKPLGWLYGLDCLLTEGQ